MKAICDVHISYKVVKFLNERGISAMHVNELPDKWHTKDEILSDYADKNEMILITKDDDFKNSHLIKGSPKKLIRITLGNISNHSLIKILEEHLLTILHKMKAEKCYIEIGKDFTEAIDK